MTKYTFSFIFAFFLIWGCSSQIQDKKLYNRGREAYQAYVETENIDSLYQMYQCYRQIKGKRYQEEISQSLLGCFALWGDYDEGRQYRKSLDGIFTRKQYLRYALILYPDFYDLLEAADNDDKERVTSIAWAIIDNLKNSSSVLGHDYSKFSVLDFILEIAPDSSFATELDEAFDTGDDVAFFGVLDKYKGFEFNPVSIRALVCPFRVVSH